MELLIALILWTACAACAYAIADKEKQVAAGALGFVLGPIGIAIAALCMRKN